MSEIILTGKQKRYLRSLGMDLDPIVQLGKGGIAESVVISAKQALTARELVKVRVLQNSPLDPSDAIYELGEATGALVVQVIGRNGLLYLPNEEKPVITLP
ncbi:MAG: YhbY family RNA-binding protein [Sporomusaceae bacterium]|nr:YhbY family RNA-binding protein [Sporomusaceae bacterium]